MQQQSVTVNKNVKIELTPQELTDVIVYLKKGVFERVAPTIFSIENQVVQQMIAAEEATILKDDKKQNTDQT